MNPTQPSKEAVEPLEDIAARLQRGIEFNRWSKTMITEELAFLVRTALAAQQKELEQLRAEVKGWSEANAAHAPVHLSVVTQLALLTQLVGKIPHVRTSYLNCVPECLACERDRLMKK